MVRILVVDDNETSRKYLIRLLKEIDDVCLLGEAENGLEALDKTEILKPDVVYLDIQLPDLNGVKIAKIMLEKHNTFIVFVTAYSEFAVQAFEINSVDYLLKPFDKERVLISIDRVKRRLSKRDYDVNEIAMSIQKKKKLAIKKSGDLFFIDIDDIYFMEKCDRKTIIYTRKGRYETNETINKLDIKLRNNPNFIRSHKCYIVNMSLVESVIPWADRAYQVKFTNLTKEALISRSKYHLFKSCISI